MKVVELITKVIGACLCMLFAVSSAIFSFRAAMPVGSTTTSVYKAFDGADYDRYLSRAFVALTAKNNGITENVPQELVTAAVSEFKANSSSTSAVAIMALGEKGPNQLKLMQYADSMSKRNLVVNGWLISHYAKANDLGGVLEVYDRILRSSASSQEAALAALMTSLQSDAFVQPMHAMLMKNPPWAPQFWRMAIYDAKALKNVAALRMGLIGKASDEQSFHDNILIANLVNVGLYLEAETLYHRLQSSRANAVNTDLIRNGEFRYAVNYAPFDWQLNSDGEAAANVNTVDRVLELSSIGRNGKSFAKQLLHLNGKNAQLIFEFADNADNFDRVAARIYCVGDSATSGFQYQLSKGKEVINLPLANMRCPYAWFEIVEKSAPDSGGFDTAIKLISIKPK